MGIIADKLERLSISAASPDGKIGGKWTKDGLVIVEFRATGYLSYDESRLSHQLGQLITRLATGYQQGADQIRSGSGVRRIAVNEAVNQAEKRYLEGIETVTATGATSRRHVRFKITGLTTYECRITEGTISKLSQSEFVSEARAALTTVTANRAQKLSDLQEQCFGREVFDPPGPRTTAGGAVRS